MSDRRDVDYVDKEGTSFAWVVFVRKPRVWTGTWPANMPVSQHSGPIREQGRMKRYYALRVCRVTWEVFIGLGALLSGGLSVHLDHDN